MVVGWDEVPLGASTGNKSFGEHYKPRMWLVSRAYQLLKWPDTDFLSVHPLGTNHSHTHTHTPQPPPTRASTRTRAQIMGHHSNLDGGGCGVGWGGWVGGMVLRDENNDRSITERRWAVLKFFDFSKLGFSIFDVWWNAILENGESQKSKMSKIEKSKNRKIDPDYRKNCFLRFSIFRFFEKILSLGVTVNIIGSHSKVTVSHSKPQ